MTSLRIALYQPDIPGNTGTILRLAACLGLGVDIIEPAGFDISDRNLKRAGDGLPRRRHTDATCQLGAFRGLASGKRAAIGARLHQGSRTLYGFSPSARTTSCSSAAKALACPIMYMKKADSRILILDGRRPALHQCRDVRRDDLGRGAAADRLVANVAANLKAAVANCRWHVG